MSIKNWKSIKSINWETIVVALGLLGLISVLLMEQAVAMPENKHLITFESIGISPGEYSFTIRGTVNDLETGNGLAMQNVELYCNDAKQLEALTDEQGSFVLNGNYQQCQIGSNALLKATFDSDEYLFKITMPDFVFLEDRSNGGPEGSAGDVQTVSALAMAQGTDSPRISSLKEIDNAPEFSVTTIAIAIIGVGLGLALLRKRI